MKGGPVTNSIAEEIINAHTATLEELAIASQEPAVRNALKLLFRHMETWELELLTSQLGRGIELDTFSKIGGALTAFRLVKDLLTDLVAEPPAPKEAEDRRAKEFTESLLGQSSRPL